MYNFGMNILNGTIKDVAIKILRPNIDAKVVNNLKLKTKNFKWKLTFNGLFKNGLNNY